MDKEMEGSDDENGPKWRQMRRLGHRYVSFYLIRIFWCFIVYIGYNLWNTRWIKRWKAVMMKTGLNDARHVV